MEDFHLGELTRSPVAVWAVFVVSLVVMIATAVPRVLGPIGTGIAGWLEKRREQRALARAADLEDLERQNVH
ncbi:MAG: hypothetical protein Q4G40_09215 [Brachybacterium sp.]|nr:hypothetical protein [Brachybacterium sp.]